MCIRDRYYGLSGISCIVYFRRFLFKSVKNFVMIGFLPGFGGVILLYVFFKTVWDARNADYGYGTLFGIGTVLLIGTMLLVLGLPLMFWCAAKFPKFFGYLPDPPELVKDPNSDDTCLLYTSDAADDLLCVDLGGRRIIKKKNK